MKRSPSLTEQVRRTLRRRIHDDEFEDGRIPPEAELATDLGVSRTTVRDALGRLENEGAIFRKQGAGTFVNEAGLQIRTRVEEMWSYEELLEAHGYTPSVKLLEVRAEDRPVGEVVVADKLFLEDGDPVVLTSNAVPAEIVGEYGEDDWQLPIYEFLEKHCRRYLTYYLSDLVPGKASPEVAELLGVVAGTAMLSFEEIGYDRDNEPVLYSRSFFRDDLLRFRLIRRGLGT